MLPYGLKMLVREPVRSLPAVLAITFSAVLVACQAGMLLGFLETASRPIDRNSADLWACSRDGSALGFGHPIEEAWYARLASQPEVTQVEPYVFGFTMWHRAAGPVEQCVVVGSRLNEGAIGALWDLGPRERVLLGQPGAVALYDPERKLLNLERGVGAVGEINGRRVQVVAILRGEVKGAGLIPSVICSLRTAYQIVPGLRPGEVTHLIARCHRPEDAPLVASRLRHRHPDMATFTREEMSEQTRTYWLKKTRAGTVLTLSALLALAVGSVVTGQTFYSATAASWRELAVLRALGIPSWRVVGMLLGQALTVALAGVLAAIPVTATLVRIGEEFGIQTLMPAWVIIGVAVLMFAMAAAAGLVALRSLRFVEPAALLR